MPRAPTWLPRWTRSAAELPPDRTAAIQRLLIAAAAGKARALAGSAGGLARAVRVALGQEAKAARLLGHASGAPGVTELPIPFQVFGAFDMALDPNGRSVWVSGPDASRILLYPSLEAGTVPVVFRLPPASLPHGIAFGPDGALYAALTGTTFAGNAIARLGRDGALRMYNLPAGAGGPWGIAVGEDGMIWFTEVGAGKVGRLDPVTEKFSEFQLPTPNSQPQGIALGADGAMWGTEAAGNRDLPDRSRRVLPPSSRSRRPTACPSPSRRAAAACSGSRSFPAGSSQHLSHRQDPRVSAPQGCASVRPCFRPGRQRLVRRPRPEQDRPGHAGRASLRVRRSDAERATHCDRPDRSGGDRLYRVRLEPSRGASLSEPVTGAACADEPQAG